MWSDQQRPLVPVAPAALAAAAPAQSALWAEADFQHLHATHQTLLGSTRVAYRLERAARRSIGFQVGPEGLRIRAPRTVTLAELEAALQEKARWIVDKLHTQRTQQQGAAQRQLVWRDGVCIPFLGGELTLQLDMAAPRGGALLTVGERAWALQLPLAPEAAAAQVRAAVAAWWLRYARAHCMERLAHFAPVLGVQWRSLRLSNARTRWGSAKSDGSIMLNWRLLHCSPEVLDYVVVHELAHLRVMDHSPRFWRVVAEAAPAYAQLRAQLRAHHSPVWGV